MAFTCVAAATLTLVGPASAQGKTSAQLEADAQFELGKSALKRGDWAVACESFKRSLELDPTPSTHVKVARCNEHQGALRAAWDEYERALAKLRTRTSTDRHGQELERLIGSAKLALEPRLSTLRVEFSRPAANVTVAIDGQTVSADASSAGVLVDPGEHQVLATVPGYRVEPVRIQLAAGEKRTVVVELGTLGRGAPPATRWQPRTGPTPAPAAHRSAQATPVTQQAPAPAAHRSAQATPVTQQAPAQASSRPTQRWLGMASSGLGLALTGVAGYFGLRTLSKVDFAREGGHCDANYSCDAIGLARLDDAKQLQTEALLFAAAGTALMVTGIVLWASAPAQRSERARNVAHVALRVSPWGSYVGGQF